MEMFSFLHKRSRHTWESLFGLRSVTSKLHNQNRVVSCSGFRAKTAAGLAWGCGPWRYQQLSRSHSLLRTWGAAQEIRFVPWCAPSHTCVTCIHTGMIYFGVVQAWCSTNPAQPSRNMGATGERDTVDSARSSTETGEIQNRCLKRIYSQVGRPGCPGRCAVTIPGDVEVPTSGVCCCGLGLQWQRWVNTWAGWS